MNDLRVDLFEMEKWEKLNECLGGLVHLGVSHAIYEVIHSLAQTYSHKKTILIVDGQTHHFDDLLGYFYKETYQVLRFSKDQMDEIEKTIQEKSAEIAFVLHAADHPVTGQIFDFQKLDQILNSKRVFSVMVSFQYHIHHDYLPNAFSVWIQRLNEDRSLTRFGNRVKLKPVLSHKLNWKSADQELLLIQQLQKKSVAEDKDLVTALESQLGTAFFKAELRLFDRLVLCYQDLNASALRDQLKKRNIQSDCVNSCQWNFMSDLNKWWRPELTESEIRGLIIIFIGSHSLDVLQKSILDSINEIRSLSAF